MYRTIYKLDIRGKADAEKDDLKIVNPVLTIFVPHKSAFELMMQAFHYSVCTWVIGSCLDAPATQESAKKFTIRPENHAP